MYVMTELGKYTLLVANGHLGLSKGYSCGLEMDYSLLQNSTRKMLSLPSPQCSLYGIKCLLWLLTDMLRLGRIFRQTMQDTLGEPARTVQLSYKEKVFITFFMKFVIFCWAEFLDIVRYMWPMIYRLNMPARLIYPHFTPLSFLPVV